MVQGNCTRTRVVLVVVSVLLLEMGEGVALVGAGEKTSTLSPLFCSGNILNPRVFLMDLIPESIS